MTHIMTHNNKSYQPININIVEEKTKSKYIGDFCVRSKDGNWSSFPLAIFYNEDPAPGHTHYLGVFVDGKNNVIFTNGESAFNDPIIGVIAEDGEVIFSRYKHDYHTSTDGSVFIDGGRDYTRTNALPRDRFVKLIIDKDRLIIDTNGEVNEK